MELFLEASLCGETTSREYAEAPSFARKLRKYLFQEKNDMPKRSRRNSGFPCIVGEHGEHGCAADIKVERTRGIASWRHFPALLSPRISFPHALRFNLARRRYRWKNYANDIFIKSSVVLRCFQRVPTSWETFEGVQGCTFRSSRGK